MPIGNPSRFDLTTMARRVHSFSYGRVEFEGAAPSLLSLLQGLGMRSIISYGIRTPFALVMVGCLLAGCSKKPVNLERPAEEVHILKAAKLWNAYKSGHQGKGPTNASELKTWAKTLSKQKLTEIGIDDVDAALTSPRDGQPYLIVRPTGNPSR